MADYLRFDFDDKDNLDNALHNARNFAIHIEGEYGIELRLLRYFFSGSKGFHIEIPGELFGGFIPRNDLHRIHRSLALELWRADQLDTSIYDMNQLWRMTNTINSKSGRFKVQLSVSEFLHLNLEEILDLAMAPRQLSLEPEEYLAPNDALVSIFQGHLSGNLVANELSKIDINTTVVPKGRKPCIYKILTQGAKEGQRHECAMRLADSFKKDGIPQDMAKVMLLQWMARCEINCGADDLEHDFRRIVDDTYSGNYDYGCKDPLLQQFCENGKDCLFRVDKKAVFIDATSPDKIELRVIVENFAVEGPSHSWQANRKE